MPAESPASSVARGLVEGSADVSAAVLTDAAGGLLASSLEDAGRARELASLTADLVRAADAASPVPVEQVEAHVEGGAVFAVRSPRHVLACVTRRLALPSLVLYDLRRALAGLEAPA